LQISSLPSLNGVEGFSHGVQGVVSSNSSMEFAVSVVDGDVGEGGHGSLADAQIVVDGAVDLVELKRPLLLLPQLLLHLLQQPAVSTVTCEEFNQLILPWILHCTVEVSPCQQVLVALLVPLCTLNHHYDHQQHHCQAHFRFHFEIILPFVLLEQINSENLSKSEEVSNSKYYIINKLRRKESCAGSLQDISAQFKEVSKYT
jgi:hypothetical protein